jgi:hypothetical protein
MHFSDLDQMLVFSQVFNLVAFVEKITSMTISHHLSSGMYVYI